MRRRYKAREFTRPIQSKLDLRMRTGKHTVGVYSLPDVGELFPVTLPKIHDGDLSPRVVNGVRQQLRLSRSQLDDLVRCPMTGRQYEEHVRTTLAVDSQTV